MLLRARQVKSYTNRTSSYPKLTSGCDLPIAQGSLLRTESSRPYFASFPDIRSNLANYRSPARIKKEITDCNQDVAEDVQWEPN